jgi:hypothetical protein
VHCHIYRIIDLPSHEPGILNLIDYQERIQM